MSWKDFGKMSLPEGLSLNHWVIIAVLAVIYITLFALFEKKKI